MALKEAIKESIYLQNISKEIGINKLIGNRCPNSNYLFTDSQLAIDLANNPEHHSKTKHIDIHYHFVREKIQNNQVNLNYIPTKDQLADIFTKALNTTLFENIFNSLNIK